MSFKRKFTGTEIVIYLTMALIPVILGGSIYLDCKDPRVEKVTVQRTYTRTHGNQDSVRTDFMVEVIHPNGDVEVLKNVDSLFWGKWNSADVQAQLLPDRQVTIKTAGIRNHFLSAFRNIIELQHVEK